MNKYRNIVTGVVITTPCSCAGENWEPVKGKNKKAQPEKEPETQEEESGEAQEPEAQEGGAVIGPAQETQESKNE